MADSTTRILLVEDDDDHAELVRRALDEHGLRVEMTRVEDGAQALEYLQRRGQWTSALRPDVVFLDLRLPRVDGLEVLRQVKTMPDLIGLPIVVLTTSAADRDVVEAYVRAVPSRAMIAARPRRPSLLLGAALSTSWPLQAVAAEVNWLDPTAYPKPAAIDIELPDEETCPNKYYVDFANGSGSECLLASPCASLDDVVGKPGTTGGPAYIYVAAGTSLLFWYEASIHGSEGQEIVVTPMGDGVVSLQSTASSNNSITGSGVHHVVFDGGPDLQLEFVTHDAPRYGVSVRSSDITFYRTRFRAGGYDGPLVDVGSFSTVERVAFVNCEFHDAHNVAGAQQNLYLGPGEPSTVVDVRIVGNVFRELGGEAIEINPRTYADQILIEGNAIHDVGKRTCEGAWGCRPAITVDGPSVGGESRNVTIQNNLLWDLGSGGVWDRAGTDLVVIRHNTIYDYANGSGGDGDPNPEGISGYSDGGSATITNNAIHDPDGTAPFDGSSFAASSNVCSGCDIEWSDALFASTDENDASFLRPAGPDVALVDAGVDQGVALDYGGGMRPVGGGVDIGAFEHGADGSDEGGSTSETTGDVGEDSSGGSTGSSGTAGTSVDPSGAVTSGSAGDEGSSSVAGADENADEGCGCRSSRGPAAPLLVTLLFGARRRRAPVDLKAQGRAGPVEGRRAERQSASSMANGRRSRA